VIAVLLLGLAAVGPMVSDDDQRQIAVLSWDASTKSCSAKVRGVEVGDPTTKDTQAALARILPDRDRPIELHGATDVPYACVSGLVSAMQTDGYRFKVGAMNEAPRVR
jgi:hypothetical protein